MTTQDITEFVQEDEFAIGDLDTLKVIADPLRLRILEIIFDHEHTVKQIAHKLDMHASKLYYHINLLEKHGIISIASTRMVSGILEKSYQATARNFRVKKGLLNPTAEPEDGMALFVNAILDDAKQDIKYNADSGLIDASSECSPFAMKILRTMTRLTPEEALEFQKRLEDLSKEFQARKENGANVDEQSYAMVYVMYPTQRGTRPKPSDNN